MELQKQKRGCLLAWKAPQAETTEAEVAVSAWDVSFALALLWRPWENSPTDKLSRFAIQTCTKETALSNLVILKSFLAAQSHYAISL